MRTAVQTKAAAAPTPSFTPVWGGLVQHKCACGAPAGVTGECAACSGERLASRPPMLQTKLTIGEPGDRYEQEADRVAEQVMRMPASDQEERVEEIQRAAVRDEELRRQPVEEEEEEEELGRQPLDEEEEELLQPKEASGGAQERQLVPPKLAARIDAVRGGGEPLPGSVRSYFEARFGRDFGDVRVHTGPRAEATAQQINALAYTVGRDIAFAKGRYQPATAAGRWILAHELTHVVQQRAKPVTNGMEIEFGAPKTLERQADSVATALVHGDRLASPSIEGTRTGSAIMLLTPDQFRGQLGGTPEQKSAIDTLFANTTFRALWDYLGACTETPQADLGPLNLKVTPGLIMGGVERFGGYFSLARTLEINPTKPEHQTNPTELVDTVIHELIHAADDLETACVAAGSPAAPLVGAATVSPPSRAAVAGTAAEATLARELGPGASNPCGEFLDINAAAQQMIVQVLVENIDVARVGRPTVTFVNVILRREPAALTAYETCRSTACAQPTAAQRRRDVARCAADIIGRFTPPDLVPALLPTRIYFNFDDSTLRADSTETLNLVALFLMAHPTTSVQLIGHTDPVGSKDYNLKLGTLRADAVELELLNLGVDPLQIDSVTSLGEESRQSTTKATHWKDRRVEIIPRSRPAPGP